MALLMHNVTAIFELDELAFLNDVASTPCLCVKLPSWALGLPLGPQWERPQLNADFRQ